MGQVSKDIVYYPDNDAHTLILAQEILNTPKRKAAALAELKKQADATTKAMAHAQAVSEVSSAIKSVFKGK